LVVGFLMLFLTARVDSATAGDLHVDIAASGAGDGSNWTDAFADLQSALAAAGATRRRTRPS
jgi:hypothetical protein